MINLISFRIPDILGDIAATRSLVQIHVIVTQIEVEKNNSFLDIRLYVLLTVFSPELLPLSTWKQHLHPPENLQRG